MTFLECLIDKKQVSESKAGTGRKMFGPFKTGLLSDFEWFNW